jgi:uncharacterized protein
VRRVRAAEAGAVALLGAYGAVAHLHPRPRARLVTNLGASAALIGIARLGGAGWNDLGLAPRRFARSVRVGLAVAAPIAAVVAAVVANPKTRHLVADEKITGTSRREAAYETIVRIPIETALAEEVMFRGALLGLGMQTRPVVEAVALSSAVFGVWHVAPTLGSVNRGTGGDHVGSHPARVAGATAAVVLATAAAGAGFAWLRLRTGNIAAPLIVHVVVNTTAFVCVRAIAGEPKR